MDISHPECRFAIAEVIIPLSDKAIVKSQRSYLRGAIVKLYEPGP